jgi:A/G-specific adenine glycosylase
VCVADQEQPEPGLSPEHVAEVQQRLLEWYSRHARDLPWRRTRDPYAVLVSEIMLQQTQVERIVPRWHAWLAQFPTLRHLAAASRADVIRAWQGLGYNRRAVRLHEIACDAVARHGGELPRTLAELLRLRGVGRYTAGAVACFAYELPVSMVDTNVRRVLGRVFGSSEDRLRTDCVADMVLPQQDAYRWNQALMDLGATVCRAERPLCLICPLLSVCISVRSGPPVRGPKARAQGVFAGSSRFLRGRVVDVVRTRSAIDFDELVTLLAPGQGARLERLVSDLVRDGLIVEENRRVRLP